MERLALSLTAYFLIGVFIARMLDAAPMLGPRPMWNHAPPSVLRTSSSMCGGSRAMLRASSSKPGTSPSILGASSLTPNTSAPMPRESPSMLWAARPMQKSSRRVPGASSSLPGTPPPLLRTLFARNAKRFLKPLLVTPLTENFSICRGGTGVHSWLHVADLPSYR